MPFTRDEVNEAHKEVIRANNLESGYMRAMYLLWYECLGHETEMRRVLAEHHREYRQDAQRWIEQGIDCGEVKPDVDAVQFSVQYCAFIFGIVYQWLVNASAIDIDAVFDNYLKIKMKNSNYKFLIEKYNL